MKIHIKGGRVIDPASGADGVRDLYAEGAPDPPRIKERCDDDYVALLAQAVTGDLGGKVGVAPRVFLKKLVGDVLDRVDQFAEFDPRGDYKLTIVDMEGRRIVKIKLEKVAAA